MAGPTRLDMRGVNAGLKKLHDQVPLVKRKGLAYLGEGVNSEAQVDAPVLTGDLKASHIVDLSNPDAPRVGATVQYSAAVHARHPTKAGWYLNAIVKNAAKFARAALAKALAEVSSSASGPKAPGGGA